MKKWQTWVCAAIGGAVGIGLLYAAFVETRVGHGTYVIFGLASLFGLVIGMGNEYLGYAMFVLPPLQWAFLGFCLGKMLIARRRAWYVGIIAIGMTYVIACPIGLARLPAFISSQDVYAEVIPGAVLGVIMIIVAVWLRLRPQLVDESTS